ncbi:MAG: GNAT family N-acetyltransferase [Oscillospiraceae bacterium]|nr:GNAT family N-acetyltransferase [Oscillospiraceae bacterium]
MRYISIKGKNYSGSYDSTRTACRAVVLRGGKLLMSYDARDDIWMLPGGGIEEDEELSQCCLRETAEETGTVLSNCECAFELDEYYEDCRYISYYFTADVTGITARKLTDAEKRMGLVSVWAELDEMAAILSKHESYDGTDEEKRGIYQREYTALCMLFPQIRNENWSQEIRIIADDLDLIPYYPAEDITLRWYQDPEVCKNVDDIDRVYDLEMLRRMYNYCSTHGDCYYIRYRGELVGDITLRADGELAIVICKEYQNRHIGRRCVEDMVKLAGERGFSEVKATIYPFNEQSKNMFRHAGFTQTDEERWVRSTG